MRCGTASLFSLLFCGILLVVPAGQMLKEVMGGERVQAVDIFEDTFVTPLRRNRLLHDLADRCADSLDRCLPLAEKSADGRLYTCAEEAMAIAEQLHYQGVRLNRHVSDSSGLMVGMSDTLIERCRKICSAIDNGDNEAVITSLRDATAVIEKVQGMLSAPGGGAVRAVIRAFFNETFFCRQYLRAYEDDLESRSLFVLSLRPLMQLVRYALLGDPGAKAICGRRNWLFYHPGVAYLYRPSVYDSRSKSVDYNDRAIDDDPVAVIVDFREQLERRGVELIVVIIPGKASIYPDMLSRSIRSDQRKNLSRSYEIINELRRRDIMTVDLFRPFLRERERDSLVGDSLYLAQDTHWRGRALRMAASEVAGMIRKRPWYQEEHLTVSYSIDSVNIRRIGDVGVMTGLPDVHLRLLQCSFAPEMTKCYPVLHNYFDTSGALIRQAAYRDDFKNARILVLGDSFSRIYQTDEPGGAGWIAHLAGELSEPMSSIISDGGASTLVREKLMRKPNLLRGKKLVVWEFVERDIRFGASGWKPLTLPSK